MAVTVVAFFCDIAAIFITKSMLLLTLTSWPADGRGAKLVCSLNPRHIGSSSMAQPQVHQKIFKQRVKPPRVGDFA